MATKVPSFKPKKAPHVSRHPEPGYSIKGRVWQEKDGELYMGWGRMLLLERIQQYGSISAAAKSMKLGYRNAWLWLEAMNRLAPSPLVEKVTGGAGGGYTRLTEEGKKAIEEYKKLHAGFNDFLKSVR